MYGSFVDPSGTPVSKLLISNGVVDPVGSSSMISGYLEIQTCREGLGVESDFRRDEGGDAVRHL